MRIINSSGLAIVPTPDAGNIYNSSGVLLTGVRNNYQIVRGLSDFPAPSAGVITLEDSTVYDISGAVDIGTNRIVCGIKNVIRGFDRSNDQLISTGTGPLITCDSTTVVKTIVTLESLTLKCENGSLFALTGTLTNAQNLVVISCNLTNCVTLGTLATCNAIVIRNSTILGPVSTGGFTISGTGSSSSFFLVRDCSLRGCAGTMFNFGTAVYAEIQFGRNIATIAATQTMLDGAAAGANVTVAGFISENIFTGAGTYISTLTNADPLWTWHDNMGVTNTTLTIENRTSDPASPATGQIWLRTDL